MKKLADIQSFENLCSCNNTSVTMNTMYPDRGDKIFEFLNPSMGRKRRDLRNKIRHLEETADSMEKEGQPGVVPWYGYIDYINGIRDHRVHGYKFDDSEIGKQQQEKYNELMQLAKDYGIQLDSLDVDHPVTYTLGSLGGRALNGIKALPMLLRKAMLSGIQHGKEGIRHGKATWKDMLKNLKRGYGDTK